MSEPSLLPSSTGAGLVTLATVALGPILGEYSIIVFFSLLGTLVALSESVQPSLFRSVIFLARGITMSFVFTGLITAVVVKYSPVNMGLTPYFVMGAVSFLIGWFSDRFGVIKDALSEKINSMFSNSKKN